MTTYRKRPVEVEAVRYDDWTSLPALEAFVGKANLRTLVGKCQIWVEKSQAWCDLEFGGAAVAEPDGVGFYPITGAVLEATYDAIPANAERLVLKEVLVLRDATWEPEMGERIAGATGLLVIELHDGATLESLDEAEMRKHGWIKERTWTQECGEPAPDHPERLCVLPKGHGRGEHHSGGHPGPPLMWVDEVGAEA